MEPCPICGAQNGNCSDGTVPRIIGANLFPSLGYEDVFILKEDVYEEKQGPMLRLEDGTHQRVTSRVRVAKAGDVMSISEAIRRGFLKA